MKTFLASTLLIGSMGSLASHVSIQSLQKEQNTIKIVARTTGESDSANEFSELGKELFGFGDTGNAEVNFEDYLDKLAKGFCSGTYTVSSKRLKVESKYQDGAYQAWATKSSDRFFVSMAMEGTITCK